MLHIEDVYVSAVAYDVSGQPRIAAKFGERTGIAAIENGKGEIYRLPQVRASLAAPSLLSTINLSFNPRPCFFFLHSSTVQWSTL